MLVILPPSESKAPPRERGRPMDLEALSFPELTATRTRVLDALVATSARPDALRRLQVGPSTASEVGRNLLVKSLPTRRAFDTYTGVLYRALDPASLSTAAKRRAAAGVAIVSSLWGMLRPIDRIPPYRLHICGKLVGLDFLEPLWRGVLPPVMAKAAGRSGVVVDFRSSSYRAVGMPTGLGDRTVIVRVVREGGRSAPSHVSKRTRGEIARFILETGTPPRAPGDLAKALADTWEVGLTPPVRSGLPWTLNVAGSG